MFNFACCNEGPVWLGRIKKETEVSTVSIIDRSQCIIVIAITFSHSHYIDRFFIFNNNYVPKQVLAKDIREKIYLKAKGFGFLPWDINLNSLIALCWTWRCNEAKFPRYAISLKRRSVFQRYVNTCY
ncbi:hypothetical protein PUN28_019121 [Cardiocondyla obscurior]|uniref:Uncharacterized protein n=1 Tax=Cardiocondyla obscurior TaxID=286306 RepID=A0AAW2EDI4_9HYME